MKVGIITFHASHNYGSMLQAYALQQTIIGLGHDCEIINFRTDKQRKGYYPFYRGRGIRGIAKLLFFPKLAYDDFRKYKLFESFIEKEYILSKNEYHNNEELRYADLEYDVYISGSDQIWNTACFDFDWSYFLDFVKNDNKRVAFSASMGPSAGVEVDCKLFTKIREKLAAYDVISVREKGTQEHVELITQCKPQITLDPTLLLNEDEWNIIAGNEAIIKGKYIFLYTPWYSEELYRRAFEIAEQMNSIIICSTIDSYRLWHKSPRFKFYTAVGPKEFLNLIKYSTLVVSGSFHAVVFSIIFRKLFYAFNGMNDNRISSILRDTSLEELASDNFSNCYTENEVGTALLKLSSRVKDSLFFLDKALINK